MIPVLFIAAVYKGYDDCSDSNCKDMNGVYISVDAGEYWSPMGLSDYICMM